MQGLTDKLYWRVAGGSWHCFKKARGGNGFESLCGRHQREKSGGQKTMRPHSHLRCGRCDGLEMERRGWEDRK